MQTVLGFLARPSLIQFAA